MKKLFNNIYLLELPHFQYPFCNCLWIEDETNCLVESSPIAEELFRLRGKRVDLILNSHGHVDHNRSNYLFPKAKVLLHESNHPMVESEAGYLRAFAFDRYLDPVGQKAYVRDPRYRPRPANGTLVDGQIIDLGHTRIEVLHLPGHIYGHCCFLLPEHGLVYSADIDLNKFGPLYVNVSSDVDDFICSMNRLIDMQIEILVTGHGNRPITQGIKSGLIRFRDTMLIREEEIIKMLFRGKRTVWEIGAERPIYKKYLKPDNIFYLYECAMDWKHLQRLVRLGRVVMQGDKFYLNDGIRPGNLYLS